MPEEETWAGAGKAENEDKERGETSSGLMGVERWDQGLTGHRLGYGLAPAFVIFFL